MIVTESCENESSDDHENRLNEVGPNDSRKTTGHSEETSNCLKPKNNKFSCKCLCGKMQSHFSTHTPQMLPTFNPPVTHL